MKFSDISIAQAAALLGRSPKFVQLRVQEGWISKGKRGRYPVVSVIQGAIAYHEHLLARRRQASGVNAATDARTREIELRIAERKCELMPRDEVVADLGVLISTVKREFASLPQRSGHTGVDRRSLDAEVRAIFARIDAAAKDAEQRLATGWRE